MRWFEGSRRVASSYFSIAPSTLTFSDLSPTLARLMASMWLRLQPAADSATSNPEAIAATFFTLSFFIASSFQGRFFGIAGARDGPARRKLSLPSASDSRARQLDKGLEHKG